MPVHTSLISGGTGDISGGEATSGDAFSGATGSDINIGGLFGNKRSARSDNMVPFLIVGGVILVIGFLLLRK